MYLPASLNSPDLVREHQRLAFHVENSPLAVIEYDHEFKIRRWSPQAEKLFGWNNAEVMGKHNFELRLVHKNDEAMVNIAIAQLIEHREQRNVLRNRNHRKDGSIMLCEWYNSALLDEAGQVTSILSLAQDITHQEQSFMEHSIAMVSERERQRIGLELHDVLAQQLAGLAFLSKALQVKLAGQLPALSPQAAQLAHLASEAVLQVRNISSGLYPSELEKRGLVAAIRELALSQSQIYEKPCGFVQNGYPPDFDSTVSLHLFRIVQEAVTNAMKHSQANRIHIKMRANREEVIFQVADNGRGFSLKPTEDGGKGIRIMNYRAESIGAHLGITPAKPHGTVLTCQLPLKSGPPHEQTKN